MNKLIAYLRHSDGRLILQRPVEDVFKAMTLGGIDWNKPKGFVEKQIKLQMKSGISKEHAEAFAKAIAFGGLTDAEAWEVFKNRDCFRFGHFFVLVDIEDLPESRWFRNAWALNNNGAVAVNLDKARNLQWMRIKTQVNEENKKRELDIFGSPEIKLDRVTLFNAIAKANSVHALEKIWPEELPLRKEKDT